MNMNGNEWMNDEKHGVHEKYMTWYKMNMVHEKWR